ncbi:hypothetical protein H6B11_01735 [Mediterraneibacter glycyrrhizinilyticus]|nr:hypothetical protein [Mediterraneibacter glycyrrhizinilyticus]MBM6852887.1 hypothetical protein [Mediterraneibacter glycyrrhizinilyticus]
MPYIRGDSCYILDEENKIIMAKVVGRKGSGYLLERVGICGTLFRSEKEMFRTVEEAETNKKPLPPKIKVQLSDY